MQATNMMSQHTLVLVALACLYTAVSASAGDRSGHFQNCLHDCGLNNCSRGLPRPGHYQPPDDGTYLHRSCTEECKYTCMWRTADLFTASGHAVPQFYGKWPFTRMLGMDEPASAAFSLLNLAGHTRGLWLLWRSVPHHAPMCGVWRLYSVICINAWLWSFIFHARDLPFTEHMDYFCAFSMVLGGLWTLCVRTLGPGRDHVRQSLGAGALAFFAYHVWYLCHRAFDYGYNMKVNVVVGLANACGWLVWCQLRSTRPYTYHCRLVVLLGVAFTALELWDFPPFLWAVDAHALWHLFTAPLCWPWYRFIIEDCKYMQKKQHWA